MQLKKLLHEVPTCLAQQGHKPFWSCDLPRGHDGDHASIALRRFAAA